MQISRQLFQYDMRFARGDACQWTTLVARIIVLQRFEGRR